MEARVGAYGLKVDGTPRKKPGRKSTGTKRPHSYGVTFSDEELEIIDAVCEVESEDPLLRFPIRWMRHGILKEARAILRRYGIEEPE